MLSKKIISLSLVLSIGISPFGCKAVSAEKIDTPETSIKVDRDLTSKIKSSKDKVDEKEEKTLAEEPKKSINDLVKKQTEIHEEDIDEIVNVLKKLDDKLQNTQLNEAEKKEIQDLINILKEKNKMLKAKYEDKLLNYFKSICKFFALGGKLITITFIAKEVAHLIGISSIFVYIPIIIVSIPYIFCMILMFLFCYNS